MHFFDLPELWLARTTVVLARASREIGATKNYFVTPFSYSMLRNCVPRRVLASAILDFPQAEITQSPLQALFLACHAWFLKRRVA